MPRKAKINKPTSLFPDHGVSLGSQKTEAFQFDLEISTGEKKLDATVTIDTKGFAPKGSFTVKCKSGTITNLQADKEQFQDAWKEAGEEMYDATLARLNAAQDAKTGSGVGQRALGEDSGEEGENSKLAVA